MLAMDGFQLYQEMKKIDSNAKVFFLTASELYHEELRKQQGHYEFAAVPKHLFLRKPINNEDFKRTNKEDNAFKLNETLNSPSISFTIS
jgi:DNA-binding LytR/AlgR family response regulator